MVVRKPVPSVGVDVPSPARPLNNPPYPVTPTSPSGSASHANIGNSSQPEAYSPSLHQSPAFNLLSLNEAQKSPTTSPPWSDQLARRPKNEGLPPTLQVGESRNTPNTDLRRKVVPQTLRPGVENIQITPRSSFESDDPSNPWADDERKPFRPEIQDKRIISAFSSNDGPYKASSPEPSANADAARDNVDTSHLPPSVASIEPLPNPSTSPQAQSRNPFRRKASNPPVVDPQWPGASNDITSLNDQPSSNNFKGKQKATDNDSAREDPRYGSLDDAGVSVGISNFTGQSGAQQPGGPLPLARQVSDSSDHTLPHSLQPQETTPLSSEQQGLKPLLQNPWTGSDSSTAQDSQARVDSDKTSHDDSQAQHPKSNVDLLMLDDKPLPKPEAEDWADAVQSQNEVDHSSPQSGANAQPTPRQSSVLSSSVVSEAQLEKLREQRKETYQIKHFNWLDPRRKELRRSSMLTQNQNGPCPLLALVNALILSLEGSALSKTLRSREQVTLGLIIESLMDELTTDTHGLVRGDLPDVDELTRFLLMLHTGMNANPRLVTSSQQAPSLMDTRNSILHLPQELNNDRKPGAFEETADVRLYSAFSIPLLHGWLPQRSDPAHQAFARSASTYEDAQTIQFGEEELEAKLSERGLTASEQQLLQDIVSIKTFFKTYPTQLTPYGLGVINDSLFPGSFAILFRNDHFSTIYKHPESGQLFSLVTDAGYSTHDEVIWESLVDVSNKNSGFFSGDFRPVGNVPESARAQKQADPSDWSAKQGPNTPAPTSQKGPLSRLNTSHQSVIPSPSSPLQEQADADFALALQLQDEEEARVQQSQSQSPSNRRRSSNHPPPQPPRPGRSNRVPSQTAAEIRPAIPPRRQNNPAVSRSAALENDEEEAPPAYEEATKRPAYQPPVGHPSHEGHTPVSASSMAPNLGRAGPTQQVSPVDARGYRQAEGGYVVTGSGGGRRMTTGEAWRQQQHQQVQAQGGKNQREREKDCIVM
ncbi:MAG: hypothetical protein Q9160_004087 [Pyrenula sp. 1 TL-2023]